MRPVDFVRPPATASADEEAAASSRPGTPDPPDPPEPPRPRATSERDPGDTAGAGLGAQPPADPAPQVVDEQVVDEAVDPTGPRVLDALVGQINGRPVFADDLLADLDAQLAALGRRLEPATFRIRASELIEGSLRERLINALILGEAERALSDNQQAGVRLRVAEQREDLLRRHGRGSLAMARRTLLEETGLTLDETLRQFRDGLITNNYIRQNLNARINVSRRDVERFYRDNLDTYQPPATRDLSLIWVDGPATAEAVQKRLEAGEPFGEVAADPEIGNAWAGGQMTTIVGDEPFGRPAVDQAVASLREEGQWVGPVAQPGPAPTPGSGSTGKEAADPNRFWFVQATKVEIPEGRDLLASQAEIELTLRERQFLRLRQRFIDRLLREGSHTPIDEMSQAVLRIAINRYSRPEA